MDQKADITSLLLVDESNIQDQNDSYILASDELKDHLEITNLALKFIASVPNSFAHGNDEELTAQRLMVRCFNDGASALLLARRGYYQPAFAMVRDLVETTFLLDLFRRDRAEARAWSTLDSKQREERFKPWKVRKRLDDEDGNKLGLRGTAYKNLSTYAAHPTPEGFKLTSPNGMTQIGPFSDSDRIVALLQELARNLSYSALVIGTHTPKANDAAFKLQYAFIAPFNQWRLKYMPGTPHIEVEEYLKALTAHVRAGET